MRICLSNISSCVLIIPLSIYFSGCIPQIKRESGTVPAKFEQELRKIDEPHDVGFLKYSVKKGDTIWKISREYGVSPETIIRINSIPDVTNIKTGQEIQIPVQNTAQNTILVQNVYSEPVIKNSGNASAQGFIWPLKNRILTQFNQFKNGVKNTGIDIEAAENEDVLAANSGKVIAVSDNAEGGGKIVVIEHKKGVHTWYAHNSLVFVKIGMQVKCGQVIAKAGQSGSAERPKLHFKIFINDKPVNPISYLPH